MEARENKAEKTSSASEAKISEKDDIMAEINSDESFEALTKAPSTGTTAIFNSFADVSNIMQTPVSDMPTPPAKENIFDTLG